MNISRPKYNLTVDATESFFVLTTQIHNLLDIIEDYLIDGSETESETLKKKELSPVIKILGSLPQQLADVVVTWNLGESYILSKKGIEQDILNELLITMETTLIFLEKEEVELSTYNRTATLDALGILIIVNRSLS